MSIKRDIANQLGLNLKEQALAFRVIDAYETAKAAQPVVSSKHGNN